MRKGIIIKTETDLKKDKELEVFGKLEMFIVLEQGKKESCFGVHTEQGEESDVIYFEDIIDDEKYL